ncbi:MAG: acyltransferase family protein [Anaerolineae bacterium]
MTSQTMTAARVNASATQERVRALAQARFAFIDNLRILLVILVVLHHLAITYGAEGAWNYREGPADVITSTVLTLFVAINEAFFMGFYFLIAAYFTPGSLERKGGKQFVQDRLLRLGVPFAFQLFIVAPLLSYALGITVWGFDGSLWAYVAEYWKHYELLDTGPLWFIEALLIFSILYALWWRLVRLRTHKVASQSSAPGNAAVAIFALLVGLISFVVRIWLPVGWSFAPLGFQFPHFPQYIGLFAVGIIAYRRGWLSAISQDETRGRLWGRVAIVLIILAPILFVAGGALEGSTAAFRGGIHWQALAYALWEQFLCAGMVISLLVWFRRRCDRQGKLAREMSASAYAVYIFHASILVSVALALRNIELYPLLKFALAALIGLPICFLVGSLVRRLPLAQRIL